MRCCINRSSPQVFFFQTSRCCVIYLPLFCIWEQDNPLKSSCAELQVVNEKWQAPKPSFCHYVHTGIKMMERRTKPVPPIHTLFSLACYESVTNPFIVCSRRIALRDNVRKGYRSAAAVQLQCGSESPMTRLPQAGFIDMDAKGTAMESELYSCCFPRLPVHRFKHMQGAFIYKIETIQEKLYRASNKGQINVTTNMHRERRNQRPAGANDCFRW